MTAREFAYWLQGYFEINLPKDPHGPAALTVDQVAIVARHLNMVFAHDIDPSQGDAAKQAALDALHRPPGRPPSSKPRC